ncbi:MAG: DUF2914 domain-containing protein [Gammaproteobacteria bacterium]
MNHPRSSATLKSDIENAPEYVDVILWHRVALVVGGLVAALAGLAFVLFQWLANPDSDSTAPALDPNRLAPPAAIAETTPPEPVIAAESAAVAAQPDIAIQPTETAPAPQPSAPAEEPSTASVAQPATPIETGSPATAKPQGSSQRFTVTTKILSPVIKRAVLTDTMRGREPGTALRSTQDLIERGSFGLFQFVEIRGRAGDTLTYLWKRDGKHYAKVKIPVGADKWRNYSSKNFTPRLHGQWQVDVIDSKGILLARSRFYLGE